MLLVLGRPGAGCSTLLKVLANNRKGYVGVHGIVNYGGIPAQEFEHYADQASKSIQFGMCLLPKLKLASSLYS